LVGRFAYFALLQYNGCIAIPVPLTPRTLAPSIPRKTKAISSKIDLPGKEHLSARDAEQWWLSSRPLYGYVQLSNCAIG